ncbi:MAG: OB-fold domain-containing protein, partial [Mycobacterium sp.]|nr:OB-fold domain-containing protein [Mycobacterium sp.]
MSTGGTRAPLPQLTAETEFFWTSGADDTLRIQECRGCAALIHPPQPVCRYCGGYDLGPRAVSGVAVLSAFTVNHRFAIPGLAAPYVVAQVAIREDPRVRLTTNIVDVDPDDLEIGQLVEVVFAKNDDVYLPLFRPLTPTQFGEQPADEIAPQDFARHVRPPLTSVRFEERSAITGIGASRLGRRLMVNPLSLTVEACEAAVADAGLTFADIDGLSTYPGLDVAGMGEGGVTALEGALGLRPTWINGGMDTFGPGGSVIAAMMAVATGMARHVLCFRTLWESTFQELLKQGRMAHPGGLRTTSWQMPFGATWAAHTLTLNAQRHFQRYGTSR